MMSCKPKGERPVRLPQRLNPSRILRSGLNLEPVADDPRIGEQPFHLGRAECGNPIDREVSIASAKRCTFPEDRRPGDADLIDLEHHPPHHHPPSPRPKPVLAS